MDVSTIGPRRIEALKSAGIHSPGTVHFNLSPAALVEAALARDEGRLAANGAFTVRTGQFTGRSPKDKFIVQDSLTESTVNWGSVNQPLTPSQFDSIFGKVKAYLQHREIFVQDGFGGADPAVR